MSEERRITREGIHIDRDVADAVAIEAELDANVVGPYRFPDPLRRRVPAVIYALSALAVALLVEPWVTMLPLAVGAWHLAATWPLRLDQENALAVAATGVDFSIGHASAAVTFHGWRARPRWSVILYSASEPPDRRALVVVDGVSGEVVGEPYLEEVG